MQSRLTYRLCGEVSVARGFALVRAQIVQDDDVAFGQSWDENFLDIDGEEFCVDEPSITGIHLIKTCSEVFRIRSRHPCWPPSPAGILSQIQSGLGRPIPSNIGRLSIKSSRSKVCGL